MSLKCPNCKEKLYVAECDNPKCEHFGEEIWYCETCDYTDDPCEYEERWS
jgi:ribosomal protein L37AE/L43A